MGSIVIKSAETRIDKAYWFQPPVTAPGEEPSILVEGQWGFVLQSEAARLEHFRNVADQGFKIGLKLLAGQHATLWFDGPGELPEDASVTIELLETFGVAPGERWVGVASKHIRAHAPLNTAVPEVFYPFWLRVEPFVREPQAVVVVSTHLTMPFRQHHLLDVKLLATGVAGGLRTSVQAMR